ncbi:hypothetical protein J21TS7_44010 [Paenibacillus cineris]|uniref:Uncharacterized protein n=1 Tax=Paenibacillus cineris TaxID=237530 RepID=A0ABQ4LJD5_9BACL|nr:hypothetical protein J21TS7_44010 [Paenibacillus cineris]
MFLLKIRELEGIYIANQIKKGTGHVPGYGAVHGLCRNDLGRHGGFDQAGFVQK